MPTLKRETPMDSYYKAEDLSKFEEIGEEAPFKPDFR
jgi:hypothetical protein